MQAGDTSLGGPRADFPKTAWDVVAQTRDPSPELRRAGFEELGRRYWKPIYQYARIAWSRSNEDAKDLTQAFFLWLMESGALDGYTPARASFRAFLKSLLRHFFQNKDEAVRRLKRGGGVRILNLDAVTATFKDALPGAADADPEKAFDREWRRALLTQALNRVRERNGDGDRAARFRVFEEYYLSGQPVRPTYAKVAEALGLSESEVLHHLHLLREEVRAEIRQELSKMAGGPDELEEEWNAFFGS